MGTPNSLHGRIVRFDSETGQMLSLGETSPGNGTKTGTTVAAQEMGNSALHKTRLVLTATPVTIADDAGVAQYGGTGVIYTFPMGLIVLQGALVTGALTLGVTGTIINTYTGVTALGSAAAGTGATLLTTEATWMQSVAIGTAVAKVSTIDAMSVATQLTETSARVYDGTVTPAPMYLNFAIADDASHTAGTGTFTGTVDFLWSSVGDN